MERVEYQSDWPETLLTGVRAVHELTDQSAAVMRAHQLLDQAEMLPPVEVGEQERLDNARTAIWEALTASGHLSRIELTGTLEEIHLQTLNRLVNGLRVPLHPHEYQRRFTELCNEIMIQDLHYGMVYGELPADLVVHELSDYPSTLSDNVANGLGYRAMNHKGFNRSHSLIDNGDGTFTRVTESISRSRSDDGTTFRFFDEHHITPLVGGAPDIVALGTPFASRLQSGAVSIQKRLDKYRGPHVRYGDTLAARPDHVDYHELRQESRERERHIEFYAVELAEYTALLDRKLTEGAMTRDERAELEKLQLLEILRSICLRAPGYAAGTFGEEAGVLYDQAALLLAQGEIERARAVLEQARTVEETVIICGMALSRERQEQLEREGVKPATAEELTEKFKDRWAKGVCRISGCPTRPGATMVGPCSICRGCQNIFNAKDDPRLVYMRREMDRKRKRNIGGHAGAAAAGAYRPQGKPRPSAPKDRIPAPKSRVLQNA